jgi:outer membrane protein assembly factor BamB
MIWVISQLPAPMEWAGLKRDMYGRGMAFATARFSGPSSVVLLWGTTLPAATGVYSGPAVRDITGDGTPDICVGDAYGVLRCFNGPNGALHWSYSTSGSIYSTPVLEDISFLNSGMEVAFTSNNGNLYVLRGTNGTLLWSASVGFAYNGSPRVYDINGIPGNEVVVATQSGTYALNGNTGTVVWSNTSVVSDAAVAIADVDNDGEIEVIVADNSGRVYALRGTNGSVKWVVSTGYGYGSAPAVEDVNGDGIKEIFVNFYNNYTCRINGTGSLAWCVYGFSGLSPDARESVVIGPDINGNGTRDIFTADYYGPKLAAIDGGTGSVIWSRTTTYLAHSHAPITVGDFDMTNPGYEILVANHNGYLDVYRASNGNFLWNFSYGGPVGGCCASGYALIVDVDGDTCVELVVRGEADAPNLRVYRSNNVGSCSVLSYDDPVAVREEEGKERVFDVVRGGIMFYGKGTVEIYSVDGAKVGEVSKPGLIRLKNGVYIVKYGNKTEKVLIK